VFWLHVSFSVVLGSCDQERAAFRCLRYPVGTDVVGSNVAGSILLLAMHRRVLPGVSVVQQAIAGLSCRWLNSQQLDCLVRLLVTFVTCCRLALWLCQSPLYSAQLQRRVLKLGMQGGYRYYDMQQICVLVGALQCVPGGVTAPLPPIRCTDTVGLAPSSWCYCRV
jgi:hypothetical protein